MFRYLIIFCSAVLPVIILSACSISQTPLLDEPEGYKSRVAGRIATGGVFSSDPNAEKIAVERKGLYLIRTSDGTEKKLTGRTPLALAWSIDGQQLAAAFVEKDQTRLVVYDAEGAERETVIVPGRVTQLAWHPDGELFALSLRLKVYSFGTNQKLTLLRWTPHGTLDSVPLFDATLKLRTVTELGDELYRLTRFDLSPLGDEIVYTRLADPPVIRKSLKLTHRHLSTGAERWTYDLPLESGGSYWFFDSETLLLSDGRKSYIFDPWQLKELQLWPSPGTHLAVSDRKNMVYIDGILYQDGHEVARLQPGHAAFSASGSHLIVAVQSNLVIYDLPSFDSAETVSQIKQERLLLLRELRSKDLLTTDEYLQTREEVLQ